MRKLPPDRVSQLVEFARFLEWRATSAHDDSRREEGKNAEEEDDITVNEAKWNELLGRPETKRVMREMAREAREEYRAGRTTDIIITGDGRLSPA
jgi:hypothetical protein